MTASGRINLRRFCRRVEGWEYENLRRQIYAERTLQPQAIEAMATALGVPPEYFKEYRQYQMQQVISDHPDLADVVYDLVLGRAKSLDATVIPLISLALGQLADHQDLPAATVDRIVDMIVDGTVSDGQAGAFLLALRVKGETGDEIFGGAEAMKRATTPVEVHSPEPLVDITSTGGDRLGTFNISTTAAFVAAGAGARVAKSGGRGQHSLSGAADLIQALGARIDLSPADIARCIEQVGFGFMFAPLHHRAVRHLLPLRRSLNTPTLFNLLGPILNPAGVKRQITGVYHPRYLTVLADAMLQLGFEHALVIRGEDGLDEISITGPTSVVELKDGTVGPPFQIHPEMFGLRRGDATALVGGDAHHNADITRRILCGEAGATRDIVLVNAGAAIYVAGLADSIDEGVERARESIDSGRAWEKLTAFVDFTRAATLAGSTDNLSA